MTPEISKHNGLLWLYHHSPIFAKMTEEAEQKKQSEKQYREKYKVN